MNYPSIYMQSILAGKIRNKLKSMTGIVIKLLSKEYLRRNIVLFIDILREFPNQRWEEEHFLLGLPNKFKLSLIAVRNKKLVGYIIASQKDNCAYIHKFMVKKEYRGKKIGTNLQDCFEKRCAAYFLPKIMLTVYASNQKAFSFYKRNRYKINGYGEDKLGEKLVILRKVLL